MSEILFSIGRVYDEYAVIIYSLHGVLSACRLGETVEEDDSVINNVFSTE